MTDDTTEQTVLDTKGHPDRDAARERMVVRQLVNRGIIDPRVLSAMRQVPREHFVLEGLEEFAYDDGPLPIGEGQTISQPYIVALMAEAAAIRPSDRVLEIGTGLGYAAAVLAQLGRAVYTIERQPKLARSARALLSGLGMDNVQVVEGDGTRGWPEAAPYDAILVAASGPEVPRSLRDQLRVGGRLIIPVGDETHLQRLVRITRRNVYDFDEEDLGPVSFVPLVGAEGWQEADTRDRRSGGRAGRWSSALLAAKRASADDDAIALVRRHTEAAPPLSETSFGRMFARFGDARVVLLGEATHGTSEFYQARARITRHLIEQHGFNIVAVEADWPDAAQIDAYVRQRAVSAKERPFKRFPTWMWRNTDVRDFVDWLRTHNGSIADTDGRVSFHGMDLYSLNASIDAVVSYLDKVDPEAARIARERYGCLTPWQSDPVTYGRAALSAGYPLCEKAITDMLRDLLDKRLDYMRRDGESYLDAAQNARLAAAAERYYRVMYYGSAESWNLRDRHMFETLQTLLAARGPSAKAIVWAHNSHIGNAAATEMGAHGELNIGQLCRQEFGKDCALIGFGTDRGTVAAASEWGSGMQVMDISRSHAESYEHLCTRAGGESFLLDLRTDGRRELLRELSRPRLERAIGVIYRPETERYSHYFEAVLPRQFDAWVWFDKTHAVVPLPIEPEPGTPETYPFGI